MGRRIIPTQSPKFGLYTGPASNKRIATFLAVGFVIGLCIGYIAMGTLHAVRKNREASFSSLEKGWGPGAPAGCLTGGKTAVWRCPQFFEIGAERHHGQEAPVEKQGVAAAAAAATSSADSLGIKAAEQQQQQQLMADAEEQQQAAAAQEGEQQAGGWPTTGDTIHVLATSNGEGSPRQVKQLQFLGGSFSSYA
jgi:hypothetical protein